MRTQVIRNYRWTVVGLLFFATTINYLDRQVIGLLKPALEKEFSWTESDYSYIVMAFSAVYALGLLVFGRIIDFIGTKPGYAISIVVWSLAAMAHALATSTLGFGICRAMLGAGESGNFPAAIKAVTEWFPRKERALATGLFNSGANIGAVLAPAVVPWLAIHYGWQAAFGLTGIFGFVWLIFWWIYYDKPSRQKRLSRQEFEYIHLDDAHQSREEGASIPWLKLFTYRQTWTVLAGKFLTDPIWWFFLFWLPAYFSSTFRLNLGSLGAPLIVIYTATSIGSIFGGWMSSYLIKKGWKVYKARKITLLTFALCVVPVIFTRYAPNMWVAVGLISLAAASHQAWSANMYTIASDMFPKNCVSAVIGIGGMAGSVGGILFPLVVGLLLDHYKALGLLPMGYNLLFLICGFAYLLAWVLITQLSPKMEKIVPGSDSEPLSG
ncbi:MAG TPA: MFS transporter [Chitinophagaceae bacterium]|nr:MFS transporter [Chitinophagaceae bacterium]